MKHIRRLGYLGLLAGLITLAVGCAPSRKVLDTEADFTGHVTEIGQSAILVEARVVTEDGEYIDKYWVTIEDETLILEQFGEELSEAAFEVLQVGRQVQIWFSGPIAESYPAQATAGQIVILE
jgi:hypothetical protein